MMIFNRNKLSSTQRSNILFLGGCLLVLIVSITFLMVRLWPTSTAPRPAATPTPTTNPLSPLLFGTNLNLANNKDQILTSAAARSMLQQIHPQSIRIPLRSNLAPSTMLQAAQIVKSLGATPVITLQGALDSNALFDDTQIIQTMNQVFGNNVVYYEYGNEDDLKGLSAEQYTHSWNALVPLLKPLATRGQFIGPVTYHYDQSYLTTFLRNAQPRPDGISWHEYTCVKTDPQSTCFAQISAWTTHISNAHSLMIKGLGTALPIMITEWNYAADASANDGKSTDTTFMSTWTEQAFQTLVNNRVFASMQYSATNTPTSLISANNDLTTQGAVFMSQYQHAASTSSSGSPTPSVTSSPTATATPTATPTSTPTSTPKATPAPIIVVQPTNVTTPQKTPVLITPPPSVSTPVPPTPTPKLVPTAVATPQPTIDVTATAIANNKTPLYRLYSSKYANHFYTISVADRDNAVANNSYVYEGIAAYVLKNQVAGSTPLYWLYNVAIGDDFYTTSASERDGAINKYGYQYQGIAGYVFTSQVKNSIPFYRLNSSKQQDHFYTTSTSERDNAVAKEGYQYESIACYVFGN
jgi:hypothetical protein